MNNVMPWDQTPAGLTWKEKICWLVATIKPVEQAPTPVEHSFLPGFYVRTMRIPAGTFFIGRAHRYGHLVELAEGEVIQSTPLGTVHRQAPYRFVSDPGFHTVFYTVTDVIGRTLHQNRIGSRDTQWLEDRDFEPVEDMLRIGRAIQARLQHVEESIT